MTEKDITLLGLPHEIKVGQVWRDNDPRSAGRTLRVLAVADGRALCQVLTDSATATRSQVGRTSRISLHRFKPNSTGYSLLEDV